MDVSTLWFLAGHAIRPTLSEVHELHVWKGKANQFCIAKSVPIVEVMYEVWYSACFKFYNLVKCNLTKLTTTSLAVKRFTSVAVKQFTSIAVERFTSLAVERSTS